MYTQYFGLREPLFRISDNPDGLYLTAQNKVACKQLYTGLSEGKKVLVLTGVAGSGKTTLIRRAVGELRKPCTLIDIQSVDLQLGELIDYICRKLSLKVDTTGSISQRISDLKKALPSRRLKHTVVLIDQVREIHSDLVDGMLSLSQHDSDGCLCIQFVVAAASDRRNRVEQLLLRRFDRDDLCLCCIESLNGVEVVSYVTHYLHQAGCKNISLFTDEALERIAQYSGGVPRLINLLCNGGLLATFLEEKKIVDAGMIEEASIHCLYIGPSNFQPVTNETVFELTAEHNSSAEKVSIIPGWPFENQPVGLEIERSSPFDFMFPKSNGKQSSSAEIVEVEGANSPVESVWGRLSSNGNWNQALPANTDTVGRGNKKIQRSDNLNCDQDLDHDNADESTTPIANSGTRWGLSEMIKKASKFDIPDQNIPEGLCDWAERIRNTVDLETSGTAESVNVKTTEKLQGYTANSTTASASHTNDSEHELGAQPNPVEQNSALKAQDSAANSTYSNSISLPEIIGKAAEHSVTLQCKLGLSVKFSESTDGFNNDRRVDSWLDLESSEMDHVAKLNELIGRHTLINSSGSESNITSELLGKTYPGFSGDQAGAEPIGEDSFHQFYATITDGFRPSASPYICKYLMKYKPVTSWMQNPCHQRPNR